MVTIQGWMDMPFREMPPETFLMLLDIYTTDAIFPNCPSSPTLTETRRNRYSFPFCIGKTEASSSQGLTCMRLHQDYNSGTLVFLSGAFFTPPRLWFKHLTNVLWECPYEIYALSNSVYFWLCGKILETLVTFFFSFPKSLWRNDCLCSASFLGLGRNPKMSCVFHLALFQESLLLPIAWRPLCRTL